MNREDLRLACITLVFRPGRQIAEAVAEAKTLEAYVSSEQPSPDPKVVPAKKPGRPKKKIPDNLDILS